MTTVTRQFEGSRFDNYGARGWRLMNTAYFYLVLSLRPFDILIFERNYTV